MGLCSLSYGQTMVEEIRLLDRSAVLAIDVSDGRLETDLRDFGENTLDLDSDEGMAALDLWYSKWDALARSIAASTRKIAVDLTGGFDSRACLVPVMGSGIDMGQILVNSSQDGLHAHSEDLRIAGMIAESYGFPLNDYGNYQSAGDFYTVDEALGLSSYVDLCFHFQMYFKLQSLDEYHYSFTGNGGGTIRDLTKSFPRWDSRDGVMDDNIRKAGPFGRRVSDSVRSVLERSFDSIERKFGAFGRELDSAYEPTAFYLETRCRNHFGRSMTESYLSGPITPSPMLDSDLHRIKPSSSAAPTRTCS